MTEYARTYHLKSKAFTDDDKMPFGKHKDARMEDVPASYLLWLWNDGVTHSGIRGYIVKSFDSLVQECPDKIIDNPPTQRDKDLYE